VSGTYRVLEPFVVGLQLARLRSPASLVIVQRAAGDTVDAPITHQVVYAARWAPGSPYPQVVREVTKILRPEKPKLPRRKFDPMAPPTRKNPLDENISALVLNATGVPLAALELLREADPDARLVSVWIGQGEQATQDDAGWKVPLQDLVGVVQVLQEENRLVYASGLPHGEALLQQADSLTATPMPAGRERFVSPEADDLLKALALAVWYGEAISPAVVEEVESEFWAWSPEALRAEYEKRRRRNVPDVGLKGPLPEAV
jgi:hypothetical protein